MHRSARRRAAVSVDTEEEAEAAMPGRVDRVHGLHVRLGKKAFTEATSAPNPVVVSFPRAHLILHTKLTLHFPAGRLAEAAPKVHVDETKIRNLKNRLINRSVPHCESERTRPAQVPAISAAGAMEGLARVQYCPAYSKDAGSIGSPTARHVYRSIRFGTCSVPLCSEFFEHL